MERTLLDGFTVEAFEVYWNGDTAGIGPQFAPDLRSASLMALQELRDNLFDVVMVRGRGNRLVGWAAADSEDSIRAVGLLLHPREIGG